MASAALVNAVAMLFPGSWIGQIMSMATTLSRTLLFSSGTTASSSPSGGGQLDPLLLIRFSQIRHAVEFVSACASAQASRWTEYLVADSSHQNAHSPRGENTSQSREN